MSGTATILGALRRLFGRPAVRGPEPAAAERNSASDAPLRFDPEARASGQSTLRSPNGQVTRVLRIADEPGLPPGRVWGCVRPPPPAAPFLRPFALTDEGWMDCPVALMNASDFDLVAASIGTETGRERERETGARPAYAAGQVWAYDHRPGDEGSLVRIGAVEVGADGAPVYHVGVIGVRGPDGAVTTLDHLPMSLGALDRSLTELVQTQASFPDPASGIAIWKREAGGVWDLPVVRIVEQAARSGMLA